MAKLRFREGQTHKNKEEPNYSKRRPWRTRLIFAIPAVLCAGLLCLILKEGKESEPQQEDAISQVSSSPTSPRSAQHKTTSSSQNFPINAQPKLDRQSKTFIEYLLQEYPEGEKLECVGIPDPPDFSVIRYMLYFNPSSLSASNPDRFRPESYNPDYELFELTEEADIEAVLLALEHYEKMGIMTKDWEEKDTPLVQKYLMDMLLGVGRGNDIIYDGICIERVGNATHGMGRGLARVIDRLLEEIEDYGQPNKLINRVPQSLRRTLYKNFSKEIFLDSFSSEFANAALSQISRENRWEIYDSLFLGIQLSPTIQRNVATTARDCDDREIKAELLALFDLMGQDVNEILDDLETGLYEIIE